MFPRNPLLLTTYFWQACAESGYVVEIHRGTKRGSRGRVLTSTRQKIFQYFIKGGSQMSSATLRGGVLDRPAPLGSLIQSTAVYCDSCDSARVTRLHMSLALGQVYFTACRDCGENQWHSERGRLAKTEVFALARKR